ncbi:facilitated trehalose transporter Tret1-2 homolog [Ostrinia furnacalis]|uniref:facilitated trehalose transporter Tret1-2 homolog n=1 Tax=Ostrinia furnacalis TaxID=93504 RepID=UPI00103C3D1A|nr:facilitated trehalose transporter Tret1-2 homolog [Ostrinia furnacalis]
METEYKAINGRAKTGWTHIFRQVLVAFIIWICFLSIGLAMGTPTVAIPQLRLEANSSAVVSNEMSSWISASIGYSGALCVFIVVPISHYWGRKLTLIILTFTSLIASAVIYFSKTPMHLVICQLLFGLPASASTSICLLILSEYSSPQYRGVLLTIKSSSFFWGVWIANATGIFTHYNYIGLIGIGFSGFCLIICLFIPESPYWLAYRGKHDECAKAHRWMKGVDENSEKELTALLNSVKEINEKNYSITSLRQYFKDFRIDIKKPEVFKPLLLACLSGSIYHLSGKLACAVYAIEMMKKLSGNQSTVHIGVLTIDGFTILGMYVGSVLSKILKRRTLLLSMTISGIIFLFTMSIYLYLIKLSVFSENAYIIISLLVGYTLSICCGPIIMAATIAAELIPFELRSVCAAFYTIFVMFLMSSIVKVSPYVFNSLGFEGAYLGFGICATIIIILEYKYLPETKDKTLYEIAEIFKSKNQKEATECKLLENKL